MNLYDAATIGFAVTVLFIAYRNFKKAKQDANAVNEQEWVKWLSGLVFIFNGLGVLFLWSVLADWSESAVPADGGPPGPGEGFGIFFFVLAIRWLFTVCNAIVFLVGLALKEKIGASLFIGLGLGILLWPLLFYFV